MKDNSTNIKDKDVGFMHMKTAKIKRE